MTYFSEVVLKVIRSIPKGQVVSYGQVAAYAGVPRAARQVGGILRTHDEQDVPWWRVINNAGHISIKNMFHGAPEQKTLLQQEGVEVSLEFVVNMDKYRFVATPEQLKAWGLDEVNRSLIWNRFKNNY